MGKVSKMKNVILIVCVVVCGTLPPPSFGMVNTANYPDYTEAPDTDPGWNYVGQMSNGTGVYLGDGWVLTAYQIYQHEAGHSSIHLDQHYDEIAGTTQRIKYNNSGVDADLVMFRINGNPQLYPVDANGQPNLVKIRHARLTGSQLATVIGTGLGREGDAVTVEIGGQTYKYFNTSKDRVKQWGTNWMSDYNDSVTPPGGYGTTEALYTMFDDVNRNEETQPVDKDFGGAAFVKRGLDWELAGIVLAYAAMEGYPSGDLPLKDHAVYGTGAIYADLSVYYDQISAIRSIPEPAPAPPIADADGPYIIDRGYPLILNASDSTDADDDIVSYLWDLNDDGVFETDAGGNMFFVVSFDDVVSLGLSAGDIYDINLKVTDAAGLFDTDYSRLKIIPEPATLTLLTLGGLAILRRRRNCK
jgi:hypothetical protein